MRQQAPGDKGALFRPGGKLIKLDSPAMSKVKIIQNKALKNVNQDAKTPSSGSPLFENISEHTVDEEPDNR